MIIMIKIIVVAMLYLTVSGELMPGHLETEFLVSNLKSSSSFIKGFFEGMLKDPTTASTNPCMLQILATEDNKELMVEAFKSINGLDSAIKFVPAMRKFADAYNQEIAVCNYPALLTLITTILRLDNLGEYFVRYLVRKDFYTGLYNEAQVYCQAGEYEVCGKDVGMIFSGLTLFTI